MAVEFNLAWPLPQSEALAVAEGAFFHRTRPVASVAILLVIILAPWLTPNAAAAQNRQTHPSQRDAAGTVSSRRKAVSKSDDYAEYKRFLVARPDVKKQRFDAQISWYSGDELGLWISRSVREKDAPGAMAKELRITLYLRDGSVVHPRLTDLTQKWLSGVLSMGWADVGAWYDLAGIKPAQLSAVQVEFRGAKSVRAKFRVPPKE